MEVPLNLRSSLLGALTAGAVLAAGSAGAATYTGGFDTSAEFNNTVELDKGTLSVTLQEYDFLDTGGGNRTSAVSLLDAFGSNVTATFAAMGLDVASLTPNGPAFLRIGDVSEGSAGSVNGQGTISPVSLLFTDLDAAVDYSLFLFDTNGDPDEFTATFSTTVVPLPATLPLLAGAFGLMALARRRRRAAD
jgi:hypothetical protein